MAHLQQEVGAFSLSANETSTNIQEIIGNICKVNACLFLKNTLSFPFLQAGIWHVYKRLEHSSQENQNILWDWLFLGNRMKCPTCMPCCCEAFHSLQSGQCTWEWLWKGLHDHSGDIFPACSLEIGPRNRIYPDCGEARPKPLLLSQREQCLSFNLIHLKSFFLWGFLNFLFNFKASRIFWHFLFFLIIVCNCLSNSLFEGKKKKGCFLFLFPRGH